MLFPELTQQLRKSFASTWRSKRGRPGTWCWDQLLPALLQVSAGKPGDFKVELEVFPWRIHLIFFHLEYGIPMLSQGSISEKMGSNGWKIFKSAFLETWGCWHVTIILHGGFPSHGGTPRGGWFISWKSAHRKMELPPILGKLHMTNHQISKVRWPEPAALGSLLLPLWPWLKQLNRWANGGWTVEHGWTIGNMFFPWKFWCFLAFFAKHFINGSMGVMASFMGDPKGLWPCFGTSTSDFGGEEISIPESQGQSSHCGRGETQNVLSSFSAYSLLRLGTFGGEVQNGPSRSQDFLRLWDEHHITWGVPWGS